jgi:hypothetical protein
MQPTTQQNKIARDLLAEARKIDPSGSTKLVDTALLALADVDAAIRAYRQVDTAEARSQTFALLRSKKGKEAAHDWVTGQKLSPEDFNAAGSKGPLDERRRAHRH